MGFPQQSQPILSLICFFQGYFEFCNKICCALCPLGFCEICPNAGSTSAYLPGNDGLPLLLQQIPLQIDNAHRKSKTFLQNYILFHDMRPTICNLLVSKTETLENAAYFSVFRIHVALFPLFFPFPEEIRETFSIRRWRFGRAVLRRFVWPHAWSGRICSLWY